MTNDFRHCKFSKMRDTYLESERLLLRPFSKEDDSLLFDLDADPSVMKFISNGQTTPMEEIRAILTRVMEEYPAKYDRKLGVWVAIQKSTNTFVGWFHLRPSKNDLDNTKDLELGYRLKAAFWGKGLATEMSKELIKKAFSELGANTVFATAMKRNTASINVMTKLGMKFQNSFIERNFPGDDKEAVRYQITRAEWMERP